MREVSSKNLIIWSIQNGKFWNISNRNEILNCFAACPPNCKDGVCDSDTGVCRACDHGFAGLYCDEGKDISSNDYASSILFYSP